MLSARTLVRLLPAFLFAGIALFSLAPLTTGQTCSGPGKERWPVKTSLAAPAASNLGKSLKLADLLALEQPSGVHHDDPRYADARIPPISNSLGVKEGDLITTTGWLYLVALESDDCDYHIQISPESRTTTSKPTADDNCIIVEAPRQDYVNDPDLKQMVTTIRSYIQAKIMHGTREPANAGSVMVHAVCVQVTGASSTTTRTWARMGRSCAANAACNPRLSGSCTRLPASRSCPQPAASSAMFCGITKFDHT